MSSSTMKKLPATLVLRSFEPSDEADCDLLEERANQHKNPKLQKIPIVKQLMDTIQVYPHFPKGHATKAKLLSQEYEIIVCEDTDVKRIVAIIICHISRVSLSSLSSNNNFEKVGWVHGLRVDESYQRRGIGRALQQELERRCVERHNVKMLYLTVGKDNDKAKSLYQALSYQHASHRSSSTKFLMKVNHKTSRSSDDVVVVRLTNAKLAAAITAKHYQNCDLCPVPAKNQTSTKMVEDGFAELFETPEEMYQGTFVAVKRSELPEECLQQLGDDETTSNEALQEALKTAIRSNDKLKNIGVISLWTSSPVKGFRVVRMGVTKETWLSPVFQSALWLGIAAILAVWSKRVILGSVVSTAVAGWQWIQGSTNENSEAGWMMTIVWFVLGVIEFLLLCVTILVTLKAYKFFRFVVSRNSQKLQSRAFAPYHVGPEGMDCLRAAVTASQVHAKRQGFGMWVLNVAHDSEYANVLVAGKGFQTQFWQKWLQRDNNEAWKPFPSSAFCDPSHF